MFRHRKGPNIPEESSSDDEDDFFSGKPAAKRNKTTPQESESQKPAKRHYTTKANGLERTLRDLEHDLSEVQNSRIEDPTTTNLFVGNLDPSWIEDDLVDIFSRYGNVQTRRVESED
jgi:RNA recognition motif-containing protein